MLDIKIIMQVNCIFLDGNETFLLRDKIKELGGVWRYKAHAWVLPLSSRDEIDVMINEFKKEKKEAIKELIIEDYSEKSFVIKNSSKILKEELKFVGGKWNSRLKTGPGWIFRMSDKDRIKKHFDLE